MTMESGLAASARLLLENYAAVMDAQQKAFGWLELFWKHVEKRLENHPTTLGGYEVFLVQSLTDKRSSKDDEGGKASYGFQIKVGPKSKELFCVIVEDARRSKWPKCSGNELLIIVDSKQGAVDLAGAKKVDLAAEMGAFVSDGRQHEVVKSSARPYWEETYTFNYFDERDAIAVADRVRNILDHEIGHLIRRLS